ncbi:MAG TPA: FHA domain-containing protein [Streptosporangiaceae bacterium]|nr:FHA domain-containing protein [Streptosporangiaceae bacterium]
MSPESPHAGTEVVRGLNAPELLVRTRRADRTLRGPSTYRVGRDPASDIVVDDSRVSWQHGALRVDGQGWIFEDVGSTNGTFLGPSRVTRIDIGADCVFKLGNADDGPVLRCIPQGFPQSAPQPPEAITPPMPPKAPRAPMPPPRYAPPPAGAAVGAGAAQAVAALAAPSVDRRPTQRLRLPDKRLTIGRSSESDLCLTDDLEVSRNHAELRRTPTGTFEIVDVGSYNGVYVNGQRVPKSLVTEQDIISIGRSTFRLAGGELRHYVDEGEVTFTAQDLVVKVGGGKILLDHVSFPIPEKCLLGVIGPSGAGKSTLLGALTGMRPADTGTVLYDNRDLYRDYAELRHRIGLVPQESVLHTQLTSRRALLYSAELRFPADTSSHERSARVDECMGELGLSKHAHTRADRLSGGQLKRVNVAQELLTKPSLLFLDEPTSGLDPGLDKSVMEQMRNLAHDGRTIVVVTHSVANLDTCDRLLVLVPGGRIAFYGPPAEGLQYFGLRGWAEVFQAFEEYPDRDWAAEYRASPAHQKYVAGPQAKPAQPKANPAQLPATPSPHPRGAIRQLGTLSRRYLRVIASDRGSVLTMALMPIVLGVLIHFVVSKSGLGGKPGTNANASEALLLLVVCACLTGTASSFRELVKERPIYIRERAAGLSSGAHLFSKLLVLGVINVLQSAVLVVLVMVGRPMPAHGAFLTGEPWVELIVGIAVLALASMCLGLLVSAVVSTSEKATLMLPLIVMIQVVLSGGVITLTTGLNQLSWIVPARWGYAAMASTVNLNVISQRPPGYYADPLWTHASGTWLHDMGALIGLAVLFILIAWYQMRRLSPGRRR